MLYIHEKVAKLGGVYLGGQVSSIEIQEAATIYIAQDDKGEVKKTQPVGYDNAKVIIDIILEDSPEETAIEQLTNIERLFKTSGQTKAKLFAIVNEECAARGISQVYFKSFSSKKIISESQMIVSLELWEPKTAGISVVKKTSSTNAAGSDVKTESSTETIESNSDKSKGRNLAVNTRITAPENASSKAKSKSPAADTRNTASGKKAAKNVVK